MTQNTIFCQPTGEQLKQEGMARAADAKPGLLARARELAVQVALSMPDRCISMDDVQAALVAEGISDRALGNAAGRLFLDGRWVFTGRFVKSKRRHARCNRLRIWRLK